MLIISRKCHYVKYKAIVMQIKPITGIYNENILTTNMDGLYLYRNIRNLTRIDSYQDKPEHYPAQPLMYFRESPVQISLHFAYFLVSTTHHLHYQLDSHHQNWGENNIDPQLKLTKSRTKPAKIELKPNQAPFLLK